MTTREASANAGRALLLRAIARSGLSKRQFAKRVLRLNPRTVYRMVAGRVELTPARQEALRAYLDNGTSSPYFAPTTLEAPAA